MIRAFIAAALAALLALPAGAQSVEPLKPGDAAIWWRPGAAKIWADRARLNAPVAVTILAPAAGGWWVRFDAPGNGVHPADGRRATVSARDLIHPHVFRTVDCPRDRRLRGNPLCGG